jgi:hypothetical protein
MELDVRWYWKLVNPPALSPRVQRKKVAPAAASVVLEQNCPPVCPAPSPWSVTSC